MVSNKTERAGKRKNGGVSGEKEILVKYPINYKIKNKIKSIYVANI